MRRFKVPGAHQETTPGFSKNERRRLIALTTGTLIVGIAILVGFWKSKQGAPSSPTGMEDVTFEETIVAPVIDGAALDELVADTEADERVVLESEALDQLLVIARNLTPRHFEALGVREMSPEVLAEVLADPASKRGEAFSVHGWVDERRTRNRASGEEHIVRLRLEAGGIEGEQFAYFVTQIVPEPLLEGDFVRLEGVFLKVFSDESNVESGRWLEGPLLVGRLAERSLPAFGAVMRLDPLAFRDVVDDELVTEDGLAPNPSQAIPFEPLWRLMAYARDLPADSIDWSAATELDGQALAALDEAGHEHRLEPYRIPLSRLQDARVKAAPENPARIERYTEGWIGSATWSNVVRFMGPFENEEAELANYVEARGFFLKNFSYLSADRGIRIAPFFVLHSMEIIEPQAAPIYGKVIRTIFIGTLIFIVGAIVMVARDGKRSRALQQDIIRRRQERRRKRALQG